MFMDLLVMRAIGRGLQIIAAIGMIVYGIVFCSKKQDDDEMAQKAQRNGKTYIFLGIAWLAFVVIRMFI